MKRNNVINPNAINILCREPQRNVQPHSEFEPISTPEPKKKSFWERIASVFDSVCDKVQRFSEKVGEVCTPVAATIVSIYGVVVAAKKLKRELRNDSQKSVRKNPYKNRQMYIVIGARP